MMLFGRLKAAIKAFQFPEVYTFHFQGMNEYLRLESENIDLGAALEMLVNDVEDAVDFGTPWTDPENNFHVSMMAAYAALDREPG